MGSAEGEFELEVSDEALAVVDRWLRIKHTDEIPATELPEQRPQRLGLGAKYLPHKLVAMRQSDALEKKLQRSMKRKTPEDEDAAVEVIREDESDEDEESAGRGTGGSSEAKKRNRVTGTDALGLLAAQPGKKKNKKKKKKTSGAARAGDEEHPPSATSEAKPTVKPEIGGASTTGHHHKEKPGHADKQVGAPDACASIKQKSASSTQPEKRPHHHHHHEHKKDKQTTAATTTVPAAEPDSAALNRDAKQRIQPDKAGQAGGDVTADEPGKDLNGWGSWAEPTADGEGDGADAGWDADIIARIDAHFGNAKMRAPSPQQQSRQDKKPAQDTDTGTQSGKPSSHQGKPGAGVQHQQHTTPGKGHHGQGHGGEKKSKKRSKQKNIKKDNRPMDQRPPHLRQAADAPKAN